MPLFPQERPLRPEERSDPDIQNALRFIEEQLGGRRTDYRYSAVEVAVEGGSYVYTVARSTTADSHWIFDSENEQWVEGARFNADGFILYPSPNDDGSFIGLDGEDIRPIPFTGGDFEVTHRVRFPAPAKVEGPRKSAWERLGDEDDPFGD